jgi:hypothetical protein
VKEVGGLVRISSIRCSFYTIGLYVIALSSLFQLKKRGRREKNQTHSTAPHKKTTLSLKNSCQSSSVGGRSWHVKSKYILGRMIFACISSLLTAPAFVGCVEEGAEEEEESKREAVYMPWQPQKNYP